MFAAGSSKRAIDAMVRRIVRRVRPLKIILFGSHARGTADAGSDVDFLVVFSRVKSRRRKAVAIYRLLADSRIPTDILIATPADLETQSKLPGTAIRAALREGRVLYERVA